MMFAKAIGLAGVMLYAETTLLAQHLPEIHALATATVGPLNLPKAYGCVIFINVILSGLIIITLGMKVGGSRKKFMEKVLVNDFHSTLSITVACDVLCALYYRPSKTVRRMLNLAMHCPICMLMEILKMHVYSIANKEAINKRLKPILNSLH